MRRLHFLPIAFLVSAFALFGCGKSVDDARTFSPINVEVSPAAAAGDEMGNAYSGTIVEAETIPLSFSTMGTVQSVLVNEGQPVRKGQLLATLDKASAAHGYDMAVALERRAEDAYKRLAPMHANNTIPAIKFTEVETGLEQAKAAAAIAKKNMDDCGLYATTDGFVGKRNVEPGMAAFPGLASITIVKIRSVYAKISVSEGDVTHIAKGGPARVTVAALGARAFTGTVDDVGVVADPVAHTYTVRIRMENDGMLLRPGMVCTATLRAPAADAVIAVPSRAVLLDESGNNYVYAVRSGGAVAERTPVRLGRLRSDRIEITDGLRDGDLVVCAGQQKLYPHAHVRIVNR